MGDQPLYDIIKRAQEELSCPVCSRNFEIDEIKVRGVMDKNYLVQAACHRGHAPSLVLYIVGTVVRHDDAMTTDDVLDLHQNLKAFNGDFRAAFAKLTDKQ